MNKIVIYLLVVLVSMSGCMSSPNMAKINLGMSKQDVISKLGNPRNVAAQGNYEYFTYEGEASYADGKLGGEYYFVRFVGGKVESYGRRGDFDSTKNPAVDINLNTNN